MADICRDCGRLEGPYSDTKLVACNCCSELTCQHCNLNGDGCQWCYKKRKRDMEYSGLTFDWDDVSINDDDIITWLNYLCSEFGNDLVWYRESSSRTGLHVIIADLKFNEKLGTSKLCPIPMDFNKQLHYRTLIPLECRGRLISDLHRHKKGFRTSRIFSTKNNNNVSEWKRFK